jgi:hypothetical protein
LGTTKPITPAEHRWVLLEREGSVIEAVHPPIEALEESARSGDCQTFSQLAEGIDWAARSPNELARTIDLALELELATLAMKLAQQGGRLFPSHERLQQAARVLAPPVIIRKHPAQPAGLRESRAWLREHAAEYRGRWVAVREGKLLGAAESLAALKSLTGQELDPVSTIVTRVI